MKPSPSSRQRKSSSRPKTTQKQKILPRRTAEALEAPNRQLASVMREWFVAFLPPPRLTVSQWADANRVLAREDSAEPGKWDTNRAPFQRGWMDAVNDPLVEEVVVKKSAQVGWTASVGNIVGYFVDQDPSPILIVHPTLEMAESWSKNRLAPMVRDTPCLAAKMADPKARTSANTIREKSFPGGTMAIVGANSPSSLASRPMRVVIVEELDRCADSAGTEGDPVALAYKRTATFWNRKKISGGTPTIEGASKTEERFLAGDQRYFHVPCPHCGHEQVLKWQQVKWDRGPTGEHLPETARYLCADPACGTLWDDSDRYTAVAGGSWQATKPFNGIASFFIWEAYSPWVRLSDTVSSFLEAKDNPERLKVWTNTCLGETWAEKGEAPEWQRLYERRSRDLMIGEVPEWGALLTAGLDCQRDRVEVSVWAWGPGLQSALVEHVIFDGDPSQDDVWDDVDALLQREWTSKTGMPLRIARLAADTGDGYSTTQVYRWARKHPRHVMAVKGTHRFDSSSPVSGPTRVGIKGKGGKVLNRTVSLWTVAVSVFKSETYSWLNLDQPVDGQAYPNGYIHLPQGTSDTWIQQLVAETLMKVKNRAGFTKLEWRKVQERNEALDCRIYARAAAYAIGIDRWNEDKWRRSQGFSPAPTPAEPRDPLPEGSRAPDPSGSDPFRTGSPSSGRPRRGGGWLHRRR